MFVSVSARSVQAATFGIVISRRHFPTWITSGMFAPLGTSLVESPSTKFPFASVVVQTSGSPDSAVSQVSQVGPSVYGASGLFGTKTLML